jgi:penicillin-binding protein 1A
MVVIDPYTGDVLGLVGGRGTKFQNRILNRATGTKRPPGSSIKPLSVYAPSIEYGILNYGSIVNDSPITLPTGEIWPQNLPNVYEGTITLTRAIATSKNTVAVRVLEDLTPKESFDFLQNKLHISSLVESNITEDGRVVSDVNLAPLALGQLSYGISVYELTAAYGIFPNLGIYSKPRLYINVTDSNGNSILTNEEEQEIVISEQSASIMTKLLMSVTDSGTASGMSTTKMVDTAGKTGTSTADFDRWFVGYTPYYLAGVWVGYDNNIALSSFPSNPASHIWDAVMVKLHDKIVTEAKDEGAELRKFNLAPGIREVECCTASGLPATEFCPSTSVYYFTAGEEPTSSCYIHTSAANESSTDTETSADED